MNVLQINNLTFRYPDCLEYSNSPDTIDKTQPVLEDISFSVQPGEFIVVCGESGCGKSTLLKLIKRELSPFGEKTGEILYNGINQTDLDARTAAGEIGFVLQNPDSQIVTDKVWHELAFGLESLGYETAIIRRRVAEMANYFGIEAWFHKNTNELSGGQKQMLNLASVMVMQPKLLLLDEPTAQLDPIAATNFINTLQKLNRELGLTILLVEHRLEEVFPVADRVLFLEGGKLKFVGSPRGMNTYIRQNPSEAMLVGVPAAMRIYNALQSEGMLENRTEGNTECPMTVREGRAFLIQNFDNQIRVYKTDNVVKNSRAVMELKNVWYRYGKSGYEKSGHEKNQPSVLRGVTLRVYEGEHLCILGGNGSGKSTTLGIMAGLLDVTQGKVLLHGKKISKYDEKSLYRHNIALLPQNPQTAFVEKTVKEDWIEICKAMEYEMEEWEHRIQTVAGQLSFYHLLNMHPYDLSGGEQQKAALAKMLLLQPKILLLDEPTKGMDAAAKINLANILKRLKSDGMTLVTVTHDVEFAAEYADRCAMLFDGEVVSVDTPRAFFSGNHFYTTAANRIASGHYAQAILCEDVVALCKANGRKNAFRKEDDCDA